MLVCGGAVVARASAVQSLQPKSGTCWNKCKNKTISTKQTRNMSMDEYHGICCKVFDNKQSFFFTCGQYAIIIRYFTAITKQQGLIHIQPEVYNSLQWSNIRNKEWTKYPTKNKEHWDISTSPFHQKQWKRNGISGNILTQIFCSWRNLSHNICWGM